MLIVEGIATSGKSSLIKEIVELVGKGNVRVYSESETHVPVMEKVDELHVQFFKDLIHDAEKSEAKLVIFDRLHFTQAFRAKVDMSQYTEVEDLLLSQHTMVAYLQVDESAIKDRVGFSANHPRVALSSEHSGEKWGEYIKKRGQSFDEIAAYYASQQRKQMELLRQSKLKSRMFDTTHHEYKAIAGQIVSEWFHQP